MMTQRLQFDGVILTCCDDDLRTIGRSCDHNVMLAFQEGSDHWRLVLDSHRRQRLSPPPKTPTAAKALQGITFRNVSYWEN